MQRRKRTLSQFADENAKKNMKKKKGKCEENENNWAHYPAERVERVDEPGTMHSLVAWKTREQT